MLIEVLGFFSGAAAIAVGALLLLRHERWKAIRGAYFGPAGRQAQGGNALIWPSR